MLPAIAGGGAGTLPESRGWDRENASRESWGWVCNESCGRDRKRLIDGHKVSVFAVTVPQIVKA